MLNEFNFTVHYIPGKMNILVDTLSHIYSDKPLGTMQASSEFVGHDSGDSMGVVHPDILHPLYMGTAAVIDFTLCCSSCITQNPKPLGMYRAMHKGQHLGNPAEMAPSMEHTPVEKMVLSNGEDAALIPDATQTSRENPLRAAANTQPSVISTVSELGMNLPGDLHGHYAKDTFFRYIAATPMEYPHFEYIDGLLYKKQGEAYFFVFWMSA